MHEQDRRHCLTFPFEPLHCACDDHLLELTAVSIDVETPFSRVPCTSTHSIESRTVHEASRADRMRNASRYFFAGGAEWTSIGAATAPRLFVPLIRFEVIADVCMSTLG
jgi:hypothetical protein